MENKSHALITGVFTLLLGLGVALTALWLGRDSGKYEVYELATIASVSGLATQAAVRYRGLNVGKVEHIAFDAEMPGRILVRIRIMQGTPVTTSTYATLAYQGITGLAFVQLDDDGSSKVLLASKSGSPARIELRPGLLDRFTEGGEAILAQVDETVRRLNMLLDPENQKLLRDTMVSVQGAAREVDGMGERVGPLLARLPALVDETQETMRSVSSVARQFDSLAESAKPVLASLPSLTVEARETMKAVSALSGEAKQVASVLGPAISEARQTLTATRDMSVEIGRFAVRLQEPGGVLDRVTQSVDQLAQAAGGISAGAVPRISTLADQATRTARSVTRAAERLGDHPESLLFGHRAIAPGPGESGYVVPGGRQ